MFVPRGLTVGKFSFSVRYSSVLMWPQKDKSKGKRFSEGGAQSLRPLLPRHRPGLVNEPQGRKFDRVGSNTSGYKGDRNSEFYVGN